MLARTMTDSARCRPVRRNTAAVAVKKASWYHPWILGRLRVATDQRAHDARSWRGRDYEPDRCQSAVPAVTSEESHCRGAHQAAFADQRRAQGGD
jgi:hypothetical protein